MSAPLIVETVTGHSMADLVAARDAADVGDLVELRLDGVADVDVRRALHGRRRPVVVTCRPRWEGGQFDGSEEERKRILREAIDLGAEHVDVEWRAGFGDVIAAAPSRVVVSAHDFSGVPADLVGVRDADADELEERVVDELGDHHRADDAGAPQDDPLAGYPHGRAHRSKAARTRSSVRP